MQENEALRRSFRSNARQAPSGKRGLWRTLLVLLALTVFAVSFTTRTPARWAQAAATQTVVTFTIDDSTADQLTAVSILNKYALKGTFFVISGYVGASGYLTRDNLNTIAAAGHEIAGHTVQHPDLTTVPLDEAKRQICIDRANLTSWGYQVTSFAYPYTGYNANVEAAARDCGYNSARTLGDIRSPYGCPTCDTAETIPPVDPYAVRAPDMVTPSWSLADLQSVVTTAESTGGGWVPFVFHQICDGCSQLSIKPAIFDAFASWLAGRTSSGTVVKTVDQVMGGAVKPVVTAPYPPTGQGLVNPSLETAGNGGFPYCWTPGGWGTNTVTWTRTNDAHTGLWAQRLDVTAYTSGDAKLLPNLDLGACSPSVTPGKSYTVGTWYKSTGTTQFALYYRNSSGAWAYWTSSPWLATAATWTQATWTTPATPSDATGVSFGLALISVGSLTTDDYSFVAAGPLAPATTAAQDTPAPEASMPDVTTSGGKPMLPRVWGEHDRPLVPGASEDGPNQIFAPPVPRG